MYKGYLISIKVDFSSETMEAKGQWMILKVLKEKPINFKVVSRKLSFKYEGEVKTFTDKEELREFVITRPVL